MPQIVITNLSNKTLDLGLNFTNILVGIQAHHIDWMHACGGKGRCTTCRMVVLEGMNSLSGLSLAEKNYRTKGLLKSNERLACQVKMKGKVVIRIPDSCKFPHIQYSD